MVYCVQLGAAFSTAARRDAVFNDIQSQIAGSERWGVDRLDAHASRIGAFGIQAELRFTTQASANSLVTRVENFATGQRQPLPGSSLVLHDCTHDEAINDCAVVSRVDW